MKKIFSMLILAALLLSVLGLSVSAATFYSPKTENLAWKDTRISVKRATTKVDGVINPGEYEEWIGIDGKKFTYYYIGQSAGGNYYSAQNMAKTVRWFFSWDDTYLNVAVMYDVAVGYDSAFTNPSGVATQTIAGGSYVSDALNEVYIDGENGKLGDWFNAYGPSFNVTSSEAHESVEGWPRFYWAYSEAADGQGLVGNCGQKGQSDTTYAPVHGQDFDFSFNGNICTVEVKVPLYQLDSTFTAPKSSGLIKATVSVSNGSVPTGFVESSEPGGSTNYAWGVTLGSYGFMQDSGNADKGHATFMLKNEAVEAGDIITTAPVTDPTDTTVDNPADPTDTTVNNPADPTDTTVTDPADPTDTTVNDPANPTDTTVNDPSAPTDTTVVIQKDPVTGEDVQVVVPVTPSVPDAGNNTNGSQTGDPMIIAAVVSAISACGAMIAKKRR